MAAVPFSCESITPYLERVDKNRFKINLFIKGMKCGNCVHKISSTLKESHKVLDYRVDLSTQSLELLSGRPENVIGTIAQLDKMGFEAIPLKENELQRAQREEWKSDLKNMAVAAVGAGNIMLFSSAVYLGADANFRPFFHWLSFGLSLPVLFWSGRSILFGFFKALGSRRFNLDLPIGLSLAVGFVLSLYSLFGAQEHIYFDSLTMIVFVILTSRFLLKNYVRSVLAYNILQFIPGVYQARVLRGGTDHMIALNQLKKGDIVTIFPGEVVPVDGHLIDETAQLDEAVLTGESRDVLKKRGEMIYGGTRCRQKKIQVEAETFGEQSKVGKIISEALQAVRDDQGQVLEGVRLFTSFVVLASLGVFLGYGFFFNWLEAFQRSFAMILVACPCAVSFGVPLIRSSLGVLARRQGLVVKNPESLKKLQSIQNIVFDKTGTLTHDQPEVDKDAFYKLTPYEQKQLLSLELQMSHPISEGFRKLREPGDSLLPVLNFQYNPGHGIQGEVDGNFWRVESSSEGSQKHLLIFCNEKLRAQIPIYLGEKRNLQSIFEKLSNLGKKISVFSGDLSSEVEKIKKFIPLPAQGVFRSGMQPDDKKQEVGILKGSTLMVGDGFNDIGALKTADFSVCMPGALENSMRVADVSLLDGNLQKILDLFLLSDLFVKTERRLFSLTFVYNSLCLLLAAGGWISPLIAVILMPISSILVITLVKFSMRRL